MVQFFCDYALGEMVRLTPPGSGKWSGPILATVEVVRFNRASGNACPQILVRWWDSGQYREEWVMESDIGKNGTEVKHASTNQNEGVA